MQKNCSTLRVTYLEERARDMANKGNTNEELRIYALLVTEKGRERSRRMRYLKPRIKGAGLNRLRIETPDAEVRDPNPPKDITLQSEI